MPDLRAYRQKRDLESTPEPSGLDGANAHERPLLAPRALPPGAARSFVVQQHAARSMHWDLRLEIEGVLVSWAVPRGPTLDPSARRLAVQTEDHPLEYARFEGVIPEGNYGAGAMIVWDRGSYHTADGRAPAEGLRAGKLDLVIEGHKLRGRFALVRTRGQAGDEERSWLLLHKQRGDTPAEETRELTLREPRSVLSGLTVTELRDGVTRTADLAAAAAALGARRHGLDAASLRPMLAGTAPGPFTRDGWLFEIKYDGMRVLAGRGPGEPSRIFTRSSRDVTTSYPEIERALDALPVSDLVLDGEIVALDDRGHSSFERLQQRFSQTDPAAVARAQVELPTVLYAFDLLSAAGYDLRAQPLERRKALLETLVPRLGQIRFADHVEREGEALFRVAAENHLEGVMAKRADSRYQAGTRSKKWLKMRVPRTALLAIVGWEEGRGARAKLGSLKLAWCVAGKLSFAGNVGSGLRDDDVETLLPRLEAARTETPAFANAAAPTPRGTHFVEPALVAEVRYTEVTAAGSLRHPVLLRIHPDATVADCVAPPDREAAIEAVAGPVSAPRPDAELEITRRDKVFWPEDGYTKGDLLDYYDAAWPWIAPYLRDRPVVLTRYPDGIEGKSFFQQNAPSWTPAWATRCTVDGTDFFICNEKRTLLYVINSGAIPLHVWSARAASLSRPDWVVIDLDPKSAPFSDVVKIARHIHRMLDALAAPHFVKTSGQAGLHVLLPVAAQLDHDDARRLAEVLARVVVGELPEISTIARSIAARGDKVYIDYLQNGRGKLIAAPFSVRPKAGAPVSTPLSWGQVTARLDPARWNIETTLRRMKTHGDPLSGLLTTKVDVEALLDALAARL